MMGRKLLSALVVALCVTVGVTVTASAGTIAPVVPPVGTPDLSQTVLQPSDFTREGPVQEDGHTTPGSAGIVASYSRAFGPQHCRAHEPPDRR